MSLPSTGNLKAEILGESVEFNGVEWSGSDPFTIELLNAQTPSFTGHHLTLDIAGARILAAVSPDWELLTVDLDSWQEDLPADYED